MIEAKEKARKLGKASRSKGKRNEYLLRDFLRAQGWEADRVPSSGAAQGFPGDIRAVKCGKTVLFELKARRDQFKKIYALYDAHCHAMKDDVLAVVTPGIEKHLVSLSSSFDALFTDPVQVYERAENHVLYNEYKRTFRKLGTMYKYLQTCDVLVIKDDRKSFLFIRYR